MPFALAEYDVVTNYQTCNENQYDEAGCKLIRARELHKPADRLIRSIYEKRVPWGARQTAYQQKVRCTFATLKDDPPSRHIS